MNALHKGFPPDRSPGDASRYFDLQLNGYAGVDFNDDHLQPEGLHAACQRLREDCVEGILATVITDTLERMIVRITNLVSAIRQSPLSSQVVRGIHLEGPFISGQPGYVGTHPAHAVRKASVAEMARLLDAGQGLIRLVTLAPEEDPGCGLIRWLCINNVCISAGHCNPSLQELQEAVDAGLTFFTHLGNGCPLTLPRHDNIIQRVLSLSDRLWISFIADGVHIPFPALRNYLRAAGPDRALIVSDGIAAAGKGPGKYSLAGTNVVVDDSLATWSADKTHLMGSAMTMCQAQHNLMQHLNLTADEANRLTYHNPKLALGCT